ncbi:hypothetical protein [Streptomyces buecherae]
MDVEPLQSGALGPEPGDAAVRPVRVGDVEVTEVGVGVAESGEPASPAFE